MTVTVKSKTSFYEEVIENVCRIEETCSYVTLFVMNKMPKSYLMDEIHISNTCDISVQFENWDEILEVPKPEVPKRH